MNILSVISPEKPPFVEVGSIIKPGDKLCIIEAMKLFNEIESEVLGKIVKVLTDDASPVEFDQPLFLVDLLNKRKSKLCLKKFSCQPWRNRTSCNKNL